RQEAFSDLFAWSAVDFELSSGGESREAQGFWVSGGFFDTLAVRPVAGRLLTPADDVRGCAAPAAVISYPFWQAQYAGSASAIGRVAALAPARHDGAGSAHRVREPRESDAGARDRARARDCREDGDRGVQATYRSPAPR